MSSAQTLSDLVLLGGKAGRRVGWANVGAVSLLPGTHTFRLEVPATDPNTTAYDCFLLTRDPFTPRGKLKPDEVFQVTQAGWFAFQPAPDPYDFSPIDLRYLNERQAGEHGIKSEEWGGLSTAQDDFANGRVGFRGLWNIANDRTRRDQDTARFLTELMLAFHRDTIDYLKLDLYELKGTPMPAPQNFDQLRGDDLPPGGTITNVGAIDSLAFLVGRVGVDRKLHNRTGERSGRFLSRKPASRALRR